MLKMCQIKLRQKSENADSVFKKLRVAVNVREIILVDLDESNRAK
jgi:hypothetical protein